MNRFFAGNGGYGLLRSLVRTMVLLAAASLHPHAGAQTANASAPPVLEPVYRSVFVQYQGFADAVLAPWPALNDTVRAVGGWRAYAKEAAAARAAAPAQAAAAGTQPPEHPAEPARP